MSSDKSANMYKLMAEHDLQIDITNISENLKCVKCRNILRDACVVPCGCTFCLVCIDDMITGGDEVCPGQSEDCMETALSQFLPDYRANKSISKLTAICPYSGCVHECPLVNMEDHMFECTRRTVKCPFRRLGCKQDKMAAEEINGHLQQENRNHSEILVGMIADITKEMESYKKEIDMLKRSEESSKKEIEMLKRSDESSKKEIEMLKRSDESNKREIEMLKHKLIMKNEAIRTIMDENKLIKNENKSIDEEIKSIKALVRLDRVDASCEFVINEDVRKARWGWGDKTSGYFTGTVCPYKYQLGSWNGGNTDESLWFDLRIHPGLQDEQLVWPFTGTVTVTVAEKFKREASRSIALQCVIKKPPDNRHNCSDNFVFMHFSLIGAGLDLSRGLRVSCVIVPFGES